MEELKHYLESRSRNPLAVVFVGASFLPIFDIWYGLYAINPSPDLIVIALDKPTHQNLQLRKIPSLCIEICNFNNFHSEKNYDSTEVSILSELWVLRARVIKLVLDSGSDVIHSDCDAFWVGDVYDLFSKTHADLVFSVAFGQPRNIVEHWGFILCMGLFMIRSSPRTRAFFEAFLNVLTSDPLPDDQRIMNDFLYGENARWKRTISGNREAHVESFGIDIVAVSDKLISRVNTHFRTRAFHPILTGDPTQKVADSLSGIRKIFGHKRFRLW